MFPPYIVKHYGLNAQAGLVHLEIRKAVYGLSQAGILANTQLWTKKYPAGHYKVAPISTLNVATRNTTGTSHADCG